MSNLPFGHAETRPPERSTPHGRCLAALLTAAALLAAGCASSPPVDYFQLQALDVRSVSPGEDAPVLAVGPVTLPEYLARTQMVTRADGTRLVVDDFNRWAEPLDKAVPRILVLNLTELVPTAVVVGFRPRGVPPTQRLFASISRFDADQSGSATLVVQWGINSAKGPPLLRPRTSRYEAQAVPADSPEAVAAALSRLLEDFSRDVAAELTPLFAAPGLPDTQARGQDDRSAESSG
jgi:uncharacterized lipoprotein YmbA